MKKKLSIIILLVILMSVILMNLIDRQDSAYLILDDNLYLKCEKNKFVVISKDHIFNHDYHIFYQREYIGKYQVYNTDSENKKIYFTNKESKEAYSFDTPYLASTSQVEVLDFEVVDASENELPLLVYKLGKSWIKEIEQLNYFKKVSYDLDADGIVEEIFFASYWDEEEEANSEKSFSVVFLVDNNVVHQLGEIHPRTVYGEEKIKSMDDYFLSYLIKINNSVKMIISKQSINVASYAIYELKDNKVTSQMF